MSNKTVWIVNQFALPPSEGGITRHHMISKELNALGYDTTVIASNFGVHSRKHFVEIKEGDFAIQQIEGAKFCWVKSPSYKNSLLSKVKGIVDFSWRIQKLRRNGFLKKPDIIVGSSPQLLPAYAAMRLAKSLKVPFILEIRDLLPQTPIEIRGMHPLHPAILVMRVLESVLYRKSDHIISTLPYADRYIKKRCPNHPPITWISNMVDIAKVPEPAPPIEKETFEVLYAGSIGVSNNLNYLLDAASILQRKYGRRIIIKLLGEGEKKNELQNYVEQIGLANTVFLTKVSKEEVYHIMRSVDAFYMPLVRIPLFYYGISSNKLFDYMASARPIIYAIDTPYNPVEEARCGVTAMSDDPESIASAIGKIYQTPQNERMAMGKRGYDYIEEYHCSKVLTHKYAETIDQVLRESAS